MKKIQSVLSDMFSLIVPKENDGIYSWGELTIGILLIALLVLAISLLPK